MDDADRFRLTEIFSQAQARGWIGGRDIDAHIDHALGFAEVVSEVPTVAVDLGSGGGLPALVLAGAWPQTQWTLVESSLARAAFLELHCALLGWSGRVVVCHATAQDLGQDESYWGRADLVTARSFGPPSVVLEAAAPLLRLGGELLVSASPDATPWPLDLLSAHGMSADRLSQRSPRFHIVTQLG